MNLTRALFISGTWGPSRPMVTTMAATRPTIARALTRRTSSSSTGSRTYSWASMAIDQNARLGLPTEKASCTSKP